jgi:LuxR family maltose regulon positive regulatory protein
VETTTAVGASRRRIIKRPRLTRILDESNARIILLVAPAGYGKTTLAQEWLGEESRRAAWYRGGPASADVAALAVGLADATSEIVPGAGDRMRERLRATGRPQDESRLLAEMLAEDLGDWPDNSWVAIDDYHFAMDSAATENFVNTLATRSRIQLLITSRARPSWASARRRLYGEVVETDRTELAMNDEEALKVLPSDSDDPSAFLHQAAGWPAAIGLAALTGDVAMPPGKLPETLYDYFAEELLQTAEPDVRWGFCQLAAVPRLTPDVPAMLFGPEASEVVLGDAVRLGILTRAPGELELHPLLRNFLAAKLVEYGDQAVSKTVDAVGAYLLERERWDEAFALSRQFPAHDLIVRLIEVAASPMLRRGRLATIQRWLDYAEEKQIRSPYLDLAEAEIAFRQGQYGKAERLALEATRQLEPRDPALSDAYARAGQSAHFLTADDRALPHYELAYSSACNSTASREALWGQFISLVELEDVRAANVLESVSRLSSGTPDDELRLVAGRFTLAIARGAGLDESLFSALHLLSRASDPLIRSSFLNLYAGALHFSGRYTMALSVAERQFEEAKRFRLDFALPHVFLRYAAANLGLRRFARAHRYLDKAEAAAESHDDSFAMVSARITRGLAFSSVGRLDDALDATRLGRPQGVTSRSYGEYLASRSLALAAARRPEEARAVADQSNRATTSLEGSLLSDFARIVAAIVQGSTDVAEPLHAAWRRVKETSAVDCFVAAYRTCPRVLFDLAHSDADVLREIIEEANDVALGRQAGLISRSVIARGKSALSARESEVYELMIQGLTNKEIATSLFISESTVKVHVRHILEKLGVRSRTEAASRM